MSLVPKTFAVLPVEEEAVIPEALAVALKVFVVVPLVAAVNKVAPL